MFGFTPPKPGVYDVRLVYGDGRSPQPLRLLKTPRSPQARGPAPSDIEIVAQWPGPVTGLEGVEANLSRLAAAQAGSPEFHAFITNLSPAMVVRRTSQRFKLFEGLNTEGLALPAYVAVPEADGVKVYPTADSPSLAGMTWPWMVFFAGDAKGWDQIKVVSRNKRKPAPMDVPWLVVIQRRAVKLSKEGNALVLEFAGPAGYTALMPLHGLRTFDPAETAKSAREGLPAAEAEHAATWAARLRRFPVHVQEDFKVDGPNDVVTVRQQFSFLDTAPDDWQTAPRTFAPVPPMLSLALRGKFPIRFLSLDGKPVEVVDGGVVTGVGPAGGIEGVEGYQYEIRGVLKYIHEDRQPLTEGGGMVADMLRELIRNTPSNEADTPESRWKPGLTVREDYGIAMVGNSERQGLLGSTIPYVAADDAAWRKRTLMVDALYMLNPNNFYPLVDGRTGQVFEMEGMAYGRFNNWVDDNAYIGDILRALDYYVQYTGNLDLVRRHWPQLRADFAVVSNFKRHGEWELSCFNAGGGDTWDSVDNGVVGFARLADRLGDGESYRYACYYFAKHAATLAGQRQVNPYVAKQPYWASMLSDVDFNSDGLIQAYSIDVLNWTHPAATVEDLVFSNVWGQNYGLRPWNQTVWMRASRGEYRMAADLTPDYAQYWLVDRVKKFAPEWYQRVIVDHQAPGDAMDRRTGQPVKAADGDYAGRINLQARAIVLGEKLDQLWPLYELKDKGPRSRRQRRARAAAVHAGGAAGGRLRPAVGAAVRHPRPRNVERLGTRLGRVHGPRRRELHVRPGRQGHRRAAILDGLRGPLGQGGRVLRLLRAGGPTTQGHSNPRSELEHQRHHGDAGEAPSPLTGEGWGEGAAVFAHSVAAMEQS